MLNPKCLDDLKVKLQEFVDRKYVPAQIKRWKSVDSAILDYKASIKFIEDHKNAYISNGPFFMANVDANANFIELNAFRNAAYPYASTYWPAALKSQTARIDGVTVPTPVAKTRDAFVDVAVSIVDYPAGTARCADATAKVRADPRHARRREEVHRRVREGRPVPGQDPRGRPREAEDRQLHPGRSRAISAPSLPPPR